MTYDEFFEIWHDESECVVCHTSGSTGVPKEILLPKTEMARSADRTNRFFGIDGNSTLYSCISPQFIGGKMMAVRALISGARFGYESPSNRPFSGTIPPPHIDLASVIPGQLLHIVEHPESLPDVKCYLVGGAPVDNALAQRVEDLGIVAYESYGMTETASHIALRRVSSTGAPFEVLDGINVSTDQSQRLVIDIAGWQRLVTNDIAEIVTPGKFNIIGRADNVIITGGMKVHPEEIENKLSNLINAPLMITSVPDSKWGRKVVLVIESDEQDSEPILKIAKANLKPHEVPKKIIFRPIPRTPNGKIDRKSEIF